MFLKMLKMFKKGLYTENILFTLTSLLDFFRAQDLVVVESLFLGKLNVGKCATLYDPRDSVTFDKLLLKDDYRTYLSITPPSQRRIIIRTGRGWGKRQGEGEKKGNVLIST